MKLYRCREKRVNQSGATIASGERTAKTGTLYVVGVPIGHLDDLTLRAKQTLTDVDVIACEDPSATRRLLAHHGVTGEVTSYGPANLEEKVAVLLARLRQGAHIALVSDCGMPVIADPGCLLIKKARAQGIAVVSVPGPSALTATIVTSGLDCESLLFHGLLPEAKGRLKRRLADCLAHRSPSVLFCSPSSISSALNILEELAPRRFVMVACDVTKPSELIVRGTARQAQQHVGRIRAAEDITLILAGKRGGRPAHRSRRAS